MSYRDETLTVATATSVCCGLAPASRCSISTTLLAIPGRAARRPGGAL